jgi:hypothetical protein
VASISVTKRSVSVSSGFSSPDANPLVFASGRGFRAHLRTELDNPEAARRVARAIYEGCARLEDFPELG